jgi:ABC transporter substrate binding protein
MASYIGRRKFLATLGGAAAAWPFAARAQRSVKLPTIGYLGSSTALAQSKWIAAFVQRLQELGWIEGRTIAIEYRWAEGRTERFHEIAAEFARLKVDVIVTAGTAPVLAAKQAATNVPIVFAVASLAHPGGNVTGLSILQTDLAAKNSNCCARLFPISAGWPSSPMLGAPRARLKRARSRQRPAPSAWMSCQSKYSEPRISSRPCTSRPVSHITSTLRPFKNWHADIAVRPSASA